MIRITLLTVIAVLCFSGCSSHSVNPNLNMMNTVTGELDRETGK